MPAAGRKWQIWIPASKKTGHLEWLSQRTIELHKSGVEVEILTTDNHADGIYLLNRIRGKSLRRAEEIVRLLEMHGGCSAGTNLPMLTLGAMFTPVNLEDYCGGDVRERPFSEIWTSDDPMMVKLREKGSACYRSCR
jgi:hypothetical protein